MPPIDLPPSTLFAARDITLEVRIGPFSVPFVARGHPHTVRPVANRHLAKRPLNVLSPPSIFGLSWSGLLLFLAPARTEAVGVHRPVLSPLLCLRSFPPLRERPWQDSIFPKLVSDQHPGVYWYILLVELMIDVPISSLFSPTLSFISCPWRAL